jgi:hypothetical protein
VMLEIGPLAAQQHWQSPLHNVPEVQPPML